ncbi:MAG: aquaporin family protein [Hyphomicrobiales bacterium]|nr:aquaporin family protein [Hyphomicrobiales bacterium]
MNASLPRRALAEALGSALLLAAIVGSGVMAQALSGGNTGLALLCNTVATGAMLAVLIVIFGPVSGAHFNPAVSLAMLWSGKLRAADLAVYILAQIVGAIVGVLVAHAMFDLPLLQTALKARTGAAQWFSECVATFGLLLTIFGCSAHREDATPFAVALFITSAYWFTASTSFANPAVTIARALSDTFAGIAPAHVPAFIVAQLVGASAALAVAPLFEAQRAHNNAR